MGQTIDLIRIFRRLLKNIWLIVAVTVVFAVAGLVMTHNVGSNIYSARVSLYSVTYGASTSAASANAMKDYAEIVGSKLVADQVVNAITDYTLDSREVQSMVSTSYQENSAIFYILVRSPDRKMAVEVANAVADAFVTEVSIITGQNSVKILDAADTVNLVYNPRSDQMKTRLIYAAAGFVLICIVISLTEVFSTKVSEVSDSTLNGQIKLLGVIPRHDI